MSKFKVAIIGPEDSAGLIANVAKKKNEVLDALPIIYQDAQEVPQILNRWANDADVFVFSGIVPYRHAVEAKATTKPLLYIPHTGSSLYRALLQMTYIEKLEIASISFDTFSYQEIEDTFSDIDLPLPDIYVKSFDGIVSAAEIAEFHYQLWRDGKTQIAVTCFLGTYQKLKMLGVPAFRIWPTRSSIEATLNMAISMYEARKYKGGQIAIQHVAIDDYDHIVQSRSSYNAKRVESRLYELLIDYTEKVKGSLVILGEGQYTLYSTRGLIEEVTQNFTTLPIHNELVKHVNASVSSGIGFGQTAYAADENAHIALGIAKKRNKGCWMVSTDDHKVIGPLSCATHIQYSLRDDDGITRKLAQQLNISVTTVNRLLAVIDKLDNSQITADDLAAYLAVTPRSARRLLSSFVDNGLAAVAGEELPNKGRPRKLYKLFVNQLIER